MSSEWFDSNSKYDFRSIMHYQSSIQNGDYNFIKKETGNPITHEATRPSSSDIQQIIFYYSNECSSHFENDYFETCDNGDTLIAERRCDGIQDCDDLSDESGCNEWTSSLITTTTISASMSTSTNSTTTSITTATTSTSSHGK